MPEQTDSFDIEDILDARLLYFNLEADSSRELLQRLCRGMNRYGYVETPFFEEVWAREQEYPTGLVTNSVNVALPHVETEHVNKAGMAIALLKNPLKFRQMDRPEREIKVEIVFLLAIDQKANHVPLMQKLVSSFQEPDCLQQIRNADNIESIIQAFE